MEDGATVLFNGSRAALAEAYEQFPDLQAIEVTAPSVLLVKRLAARGRESADEIADRIARSCKELPEGLPLRRVMNDGTVEEGVERLLAALQPVRA